MQAQALDILRKIGAQLDKNQFPRVFNEGIVKPCESDVFSSTQGKDKDNATSRSRRPSTEPWQRTAGRQRQANGSRASSRTPPVICPTLQMQYESELGAVKTAYPSMEYWCQKEGLWLLTESILIPGLDKKATFLTAIPYNLMQPAKSWGFWTSPVFHQWIGPRHTNFPDGSICAFEPKDKTWTAGDSIVKLLDLYTLWAVRHQYLEIFGKWAGYQSVHHPYERLTELKDNEYCGCASSDKLYSECCKPKDVARDRTVDTLSFHLTYLKAGLRKPPMSVTKFIWARNNPPPIIDCF